MTTATAEKPTCKYSLQPDEFFHTQCGQIRFPDVVNKYTYCPDCGRKVSKVQGEGDSE